MLLCWQVLKDAIRYGAKAAKDLDADTSDGPEPEKEEQLIDTKVRAKVLIKPSA